MYSLAFTIHLNCDLEQGRQLLPGGGWDGASPPVQNVEGGVPPYIPGLMPLNRPSGTSVYLH